MESMAILSMLEELGNTSFANDGERIQALFATYALMSKLETPWETILNGSSSRHGI